MTADLLISRPDLHSELECIASDELSTFLAGDRSPETLKRVRMYLSDESDQGGMLSRDQLISTHLRDDLQSADYRAARTHVTRILTQARTLLSLLCSMDLDAIESPDRGHSETCPVLEHFAGLWSRYLTCDRATRDHSGLLGCLIEYGPGGDQEAEVCDCGLSSSDLGPVQDQPSSGPAAHQVPDQGPVQVRARSIPDVATEVPSVEEAGIHARICDTPSGRLLARALEISDELGTPMGEAMERARFESEERILPQEAPSPDARTRALSDSALLGLIDQWRALQGEAGAAEALAGLETEAARRGLLPDLSQVRHLLGGDVAQVADWAFARLQGPCEPIDDPSPAEDHLCALQAIRTLIDYLEACPFSSLDVSPGLRAESRGTHIFG